MLGGVGKYWEVFGRRRWEVLGNVGRWWEVLGDAVGAFGRCFCVCVCVCV